jgi:histidinol-phosphate aminotransferase
VAHYCRDVASLPRPAARYHGEQAALPGMLDFAVNVRAGVSVDAPAETWQ